MTILLNEYEGLSSPCILSILFQSYPSTSLVHYPLSMKYPLPRNWIPPLTTTYTSETFQSQRMDMSQFDPKQHFGENARIASETCSDVKRVAWSAVRCRMLRERKFHCGAAAASVLPCSESASLSVWTVDNISPNPNKTSKVRIYSDIVAEWGRRPPHFCYWSPIPALR